MELKYFCFQLYNVASKSRVHCRNRRPLTAFLNYLQNPILIGCGLISILGYIALGASEPYAVDRVWFGVSLVLIVLGVAMLERGNAPSPMPWLLLIGNASVCHLPRPQSSRITCSPTWCDAECLMGASLLSVRLERPSSGLGLSHPHRNAWIEVSWKIAPDHLGGPRNRFVADRKYAPENGEKLVGSMFPRSRCYATPMSSNFPCHAYW